MQYVSYSLQAGYVHNWLVAGPHARPVTSSEAFDIARRHDEGESGLDEPPSEGDAFALDGTKLRWEYFRCRDDHFVDFTGFYGTRHHVRAWAYARLHAGSARDVTLTLSTNRSANVWLNRRHVHRQGGLDDRTPESASFSASLRKGDNEILVRLEAVATREYACGMALGIALPSQQTAEAVLVLLPTSVETVERRQALEEMFDAAYLDRDVFVGDDEIIVRLPDGMPAPTTAVVRLQTPRGRIYFESERLSPVGANDARLGRAYDVPEGRYEAFLMPGLEEFYIENLRIHRRVALWTATNRYTEAPASYSGRRLEALEDAARRESGASSEIARMALDRWSDVSTDVLMEAIQAIDRRQDGCVLDLVALLGMIHRHGKASSFPAVLGKPLEHCVLNFKYWMDEPGDDAMCFWSESRQILFHTCEILAGQLFRDRIFANTRRTGRWHRALGEHRASAWLAKRGAGGFRDWDSNGSFEEDLLALAHLVDLSKTSRVYDLAAVVLDKMLFTMALNSYRGVFGSSHGRSCASMIKGGRLEATAGVGRLLWGLGVFNAHARATVGLAGAEDYELPPQIAAVATDLPDEIWNRERHVGELEERCDRATGAWAVDKVTYKTPDYMLCSAQDHRAGESGCEEHIWQATMGPDAVVFANHPRWVSEEDAHRPNFWRGNGVLPRVAQWKDVLIAIHKLPDDDWLGFTHAYFPLHAFDEHELRRDADGHRWAFARKAEGYLALTASRGLDLISRGDNAYRELRSYGKQIVWLCHMGRAALDGGFGAFQEKVLSLDVVLGDLSVRCQTLRGDGLAFGWEGPLLRNGIEQPITGFKHYDNPYCVAELPAERMEVRYGDQLLRLSFAQ